MCDQHGTKIMQRYIKVRRLQQLMGEIGTLSVAKRTSAPALASLAVDPRQVSQKSRFLRLPGILASLRNYWQQMSWPRDRFQCLVVRSHVVNVMLAARH